MKLWTEDIPERLGGRPDKVCFRDHNLPETLSLDGAGRGRAKYLNKKSRTLQENFRYSFHDFHKSIILPSSAISYLIVLLLISMSLLMCVRITRFARISGKCFSKVLRFM